ncbi:GNAT family acetyltransferase [Pseudoxanthomonas sp. GM95]|uniref:GNAT family N-acetyltransferase n=1 Tax=Pseudoxanthomonas sp. GM95 TaxID=1881043 RepID=UPI0020C8A426|nr:GNAT family acetyltransferase [Pseudoxanthomonas sp. GM95]
MQSNTQILVRHGREMNHWFDAVAHLRMKVFRQYPYLYAGSLEYERGYLASYARSHESVLILVVDGKSVVGASTGIPLAQADKAFQLPLAGRGVDIDSVFYCGESVLLPEYRGQGIGHQFFDRREAHAHKLENFQWTAFASVDRSHEDPNRPAQYRSNEAFWLKRGYAPSDMKAQLHWRQIGDDTETTHAMTMWMRALERKDEDCSRQIPDSPAGKLREFCAASARPAA